MRKGLLVAFLALGVAAASFGVPEKKSAKPKYHAKADTSMRHKSGRAADRSSLEKMIKEMEKHSMQGWDDAFAMLDSMPMMAFTFPADMDSLIRMSRSEFLDSTGNCKFRRDGRMPRGPRMNSRTFSMNTDSLGNSQSIVMFSDGKKTTIIKNGKDTTIVDGPMDGSINGFTMDFPQMDQMMPRFNFRGFGGPFDNGFDNGLGNTKKLPYKKDLLTPETPSVQELDLLVKKNIIASKDNRNSLNIDGISVLPNGKEGTFSVIFYAHGLDQCNLQVADKNGTLIEKATIIGEDGNFRRTVKVDKGQDFVYVVVSNGKKNFVNKFWF